MNSETETYRKMAHRVRNFHFGWLLMMFAGTITEICYPSYAPIQLLLTIATALFQILIGQGECPVTLFENFLWEKCDPSKVYKGSFVRHYLKKSFLKINAPPGTTTALLVIVLTVTIWVMIIN
jgi:hypothetical protein